MVKKLIYSCIIIFSFVSCGKSHNDDKIIAKAGKYNLYMNELLQSLPKDLSKKDSAVYVQNFINQWLNSKVLLIQAEKNVNIDDEKLDKQLQEYRNSLIIYEYQKLLVYQKLDTLVSDEEIEQYYQEHQDDFLLKDNIVKVTFVKMVKNGSNSSQIKQLVKDYIPNEGEKLKDLAEKYAVNYFIDDEVWLMLNDLVKEVPIESYNYEMFLQNNKYVELQDSLFQYYLKINSFRIKNSISPLNYETEKIRSLIINRRKINLIKTMENDIFQKAQKSGEIKIYN